MLLELTVETIHNDVSSALHKRIEAAGDAPGLSINQLDGIPLRIGIEEFVKEVGRAVGPVDCVGAQADTHAQLGTLLRHPPVDLPPRIGEDGRVLRISGPARIVGVRVVHLDTANPFFVQLPQLPQQAFGIKIITRPPPERHLPISGRWIAESRQHVQIRCPARIARRQRWRFCPRSSPGFSEAEGRSLERCRFVHQRC